MKHNKTVLGMLLAAWASGAYAADERFVTLSGGFEYSSGKYGTSTTTNIVSIPVNALYESGAWAFKLSVPYLLVNGSGEVVASGMHSGRTSTGTMRGARMQTGLGDVVSMATYNVYAGSDYESGIDLSGRIKFGTASKVLGTGESDYALQLYGYRDIADFSPNIMLGYEVLGSSAELPLDNVWFGSVGSGYRFNEQTSAGGGYKYAQKASIAAAPQRELTLYANRQLSSNTYLHAYLLKGYADGSPDYGFGMSVSAVF